MATPEKIASQPEDVRPDLTVLAGGLSVAETTSLTPIDIDGPYEAFQADLHDLIRGGDYITKTSEELTEIRGDVQSVRDALSDRWAELAAQMDTVQREMTWTNGYLIDLNKEIQARS